MDPKTHSRYLDYLELRKYFARSPDLPKLPLDEFAVLDAELRALVAKEAEGKAVPEEVRRIVQLRRVLFRD